MSIRGRFAFGWYIVKAGKNGGRTAQKALKRKQQTRRRWLAIAGSLRFFSFLLQKRREASEQRRDERRGEEKGTKFHSPSLCLALCSPGSPRSSCLPVSVVRGAGAGGDAGAGAHTAVCFLANRSAHSCCVYCVCGHFCLLDLVRARETTNCSVRNWYS